SDLHTIKNGTACLVERMAPPVVLHTRDEALDAEPALRIHRRLITNKAEIGIGLLADHGAKLHVNPGFPLLIDDPADHRAPGLELHGEVPGLVALQDERAGELPARVNKVESVTASGQSFDQEVLGVPRYLGKM